MANTTKSTAVPEAGQKNCDTCCKQGFSIKKEWSSVLFLLALTGCVILGVLFVNAKRDNAALQREKTPSPSTQQVVKEKIMTATPSVRIYQNLLELPKPKVRGTVSIEQVLNERRTRRSFSNQIVTKAELGQMLWAGQGITEQKTGKRTAPSAYEVYPFTLFVVVRNVEKLSAGVYEYLPKEHALGLVQNDVTAFDKSGVQPGAQQAPVVFIIAAAYGKGADKLKDNAIKSAILEAGHISQNLYLEAESLGMATVAMGGFDSSKVITALGLDKAFTIDYVQPFGHRAPEPTGAPNE